MMMLKIKCNHKCFLYFLILICWKLKLLFLKWYLENPLPFCWFTIYKVWLRRTCENKIGNRIFSQIQIFWGIFTIFSGQLKDDFVHIKEDLEIFSNPILLKVIENYLDDFWIKLVFIILCLHFCGLDKQLKSTKVL